MIYTVTLTPALDKTVTVPGFSVDTVNRIETVQTDAGGKGVNVSRWVRMLGGETVAMGILGGEPGRFIARTLEEDGVEAAFVWIDADTRTNLKVIDPQKRTNTDINEPGAPVDSAVLSAVYDGLRARLKPGDIVVLAGKTPPGTPDALLPTWISAFGELGAKVFVDVDGPALMAATLAEPYFIKPNRDELEALIGRRLTAVDDVVDAARSLLAGGINRVCVTLGPNGAMLLSQTQGIYAEGLSVPVGSTVGAGDATVAALAYAEAEGMNDADALRLAIAAGAASVMQPGTRVAPRKQVMELEKTVQEREIRV